MKVRVLAALDDVRAPQALVRIERRPRGPMHRGSRRDIKVPLPSSFPRHHNLKLHALPPIKIVNLVVADSERAEPGAHAARDDPVDCAAESAGDVGGDVVEVGVGDEDDLDGEEVGEGAGAGAETGRCEEAVDRLEAVGIEFVSG